MNVLDKTIVLKLNRSWNAVDQMSVREAVVFLNSESGGKPPGYALDITTAVDENGDHVLVNAQPTKWEDWVKLPIREDDLWIGVGRSADNPEGRIRAPLVVICANYDKVQLRAPRLSAEAIRKRDGGRCQYTGRKLAPSEGNLDHVHPRSRGGKDTFENLVWADKQINTRKGNKTPEEAGFKLLSVPKAPPAVPPVVHLRADPKHPVWKPFLS